ncbi:hypothetical protein P879_00713 [Paragonimus westermani]|uniref:Cdc23 domain-containing protein n=1 Tax=Paragonimus westermani TaxID=34504 RepID=A0A8T0DPH8_9TREM|nr:hypothetical protein P879_00713 [Paragonimus westermani]
MKSSIESEEVALPIDSQSVRSDLLRAFFDCQVRGLTQSCKWLGDLLCALDESRTKSVDSSHNGSLSPSPMANIPSKQLSGFLLARSLLDGREYDHCAQTLRHFVSPLLRSWKDDDSLNTNCHPLVYFMYIYSSYMACEKRRANDEVELRRVFEKDGSTKPSQVARAHCLKELSALRSEVESRMGTTRQDLEKADGVGETDPFVLYVFGLIYHKLAMKSTAVSMFVRAINAYPCLWPAWYELSQLVKDKEHLNCLRLPSTSQAWMRHFFEVKVFLKLNESERALNLLQRLSNSGFDASGNLQADIGLAFDGLRDMEMAGRQFYQLFANFPCRLDNVDAYSNVLFVREDSVELAHLAHHCVELDKYRPETCCVVGNFYSLRGQHDKAVLYFQRALKLKPSYSLVWTLVGHEYTELRNTNAAVHAYRQAIAHNKHDFRAWYGLGQMYEILDLPSFALYYYREAQYLVPTDSRLIVALGEIYERLNRLDEAKKCYWRAHCVGDIEGSALVRLATCFAQCGEVAEAAAAFTEFIKVCEHHGVHSQTELAQAYKYLATYHLKMGHYEDSAAAASRCLEFPETREEAKALFRQITVLAGDVEVALTDRSSDDPPSTEEDTDFPGHRNPNEMVTETGRLRETPCPKLSSEMPMPSLPIEGCNQPPKASVPDQTPPTQTQPLDLSLGYLLAALGETPVAAEDQLDSSKRPDSLHPRQTTCAPLMPELSKLWVGTEQRSSSADPSLLGTTSQLSTSVVSTPLANPRASRSDSPTSSETSQ